MDRDTQLIYEFIKKHDIGVLSTVTSDFLPESAVVGYSSTENLELIFGTFNDSRKYRNIQKNPQVAMVIGWDYGKTVQYEGEAVELVGQERLDAINDHLSKIPSAAKFYSDFKIAVFKVTPKWIRYTDVSFDPWDIVEIRM